MEEYLYKEKANWEVVLDILLFFCVFVVFIFLFIETLSNFSDNINAQKVNELYFWISIPILLVFFVDLVRLYYESFGFLDFISKSWLDILATIPVNLIGFLIFGGYSQTSFEVLKIVRISRLTRIFRIGKITKTFKAAAHLKRESEKYKDKRRF